LKALLADIGGTNARFALLRGATHGPHLFLPVADFATVEDALARALAELAPEGGVDAAVLALAGPVVAGSVRMTNAPWEISSDTLASHFGFLRVRLVNDFLAQAYALPHLAGADLLPIGAGQAAPGAPMLVLGPGTGLGMAGFLPGPGIAVATEGGHAGLAPTDAREDAVVAALRARCGRAGAEEALSGGGLANLHAVVASLRGAEVPERDAAAVVAAAAGECAVAAEALELFLDFCASFAGDMALAWGARGGVFLAGGILPRLAATLDTARFRARFEAKAPMEQFIAGVPLHLVVHEAPAFLGLAALARLTEA
jgi:glucokinase